HERAELFVEAVVLLPRAARREELAQGVTPAQLRHGAEAHHAVVGEARAQRVDVPRHEQRLDVGDERARLLDGARVARLFLAQRLNRHPFLLRLGPLARLYRPCSVTAPPASPRSGLKRPFSLTPRAPRVRPAGAEEP